MEFYDEPEVYRPGVIAWLALAGVAFSVGFVLGAGGMVFFLTGAWLQR